MNYFSKLIGPLLIIGISGGCYSLGIQPAIGTKTKALTKRESLSREKITPYSIERLPPSITLELKLEQEELSEKEIEALVDYLMELKNFKNFEENKPTVPIIPDIPDANGVISHQKHEDQEVWIYTSRRYDTWDQGYWVAISEKGKLRKYYTGLKEFSPYILVRTNKLPILAKDQIRVVAKKKELIQETVGAIHPEFNEEEGYFVLVFYIKDLERDIDGDGLTDLEEERLLTDPQSTDTDGDGTNDALDVNPLSSNVITQTDKAKLYSLVLKDNYKGSQQYDLIILENEENFDLRESDIKLLILSNRELNQYRKKFGHTRPTSISIRKYIEPSEFDKRDQRGLMHRCQSSLEPFQEPFTEGDEKACIYIYGWLHAGYQAEKINGEWKIERLY